MSPRRRALPLTGLAVLAFGACLPPAPGPSTEPAPTPAPAATSAPAATPAPQPVAPVVAAPPDLDAVAPDAVAESLLVDVAGAVKNAKAGQVQYRADKTGIVQCTIGRASFTVIRRPSCS